jgi:hypothetical protein
LHKPPGTASSVKGKKRRNRSPTLAEPEASRLRLPGGKSNQTAGDCARWQHPKVVPISEGGRHNRRPPSEGRRPAGGVLPAKQAPPRPGTAPAPGFGAPGHPQGQAATKLGRAELLQSRLAPPAALFRRRPYPAALARKAARRAGKDFFRKFGRSRAGTAISPARAPGTGLPGPPSGRRVGRRAPAVPASFHQPLLKEYAMFPSCWRRRSSRAARSARPTAPDPAAPPFARRS